MGYIESGKKEGATLHSGGNVCDGDGYFVQPTVFVDCKPGMRIVEEEIFGPVASIIRFDTEEGVYLWATYICCISPLNDTQRSLKWRMTPRTVSHVPFSQRIQVELSACQMHWKRE